MSGPAPTIGRIVHVTLDDGEARPAIITQVWSDDCVNLRVFLDGENDDRPERTLGGNVIYPSGWATSVQRADSSEPFRWHWPVRS